MTSLCIIIKLKEIEKIKTEECGLKSFKQLQKLEVSKARYRVGASECTPHKATKATSQSGLRAKRQSEKGLLYLQRQYKFIDFSCKTSPVVYIFYRTAPK